MKRSLLSLAVQAACTGQHPADARDTDAGWWQHQGPPAMTGVRFQPSPPPLHESYVTIVHSEPNWIEQLRAPANLEPGDTPLYRGEIGTLDCGYTFKPSRPPVLIGVDMGSGRDVGVTGRWVDGKLEVIEHVRTGPGTPFALIDDMTKQVDDLCGVRQVSEAFARREHEQQKNIAMAERLERMETRRVPRIHCPVLPDHNCTHQCVDKCQDAVLVAMPADPHCAMKPQCPGALGKGCYLCEPGPFDTAWGDRASLDGLEVEVGPMLFEMPTMGAEWSGVPGDPFINLERVRRTPLGSEPWDHASTEAA